MGVYSSYAISSMKSLFTTILLVSFVGIGFLGFAGMYHSNQQNHNDGCIWATSQGINCPKQSNPINYLTLHLNAFKDFSTVIFDNVATTLLIFSLFIVGATLGILLENLAPPKLSLAYQRLKRSDSFHSSFQYKLIHWLALHENSPTIS